MACIQYHLEEILLNFPLYSFCFAISGELRHLLQTMWFDLQEDIPKIAWERVWVAAKQNRFD